MSNVPDQGVAADLSYRQWLLERQLAWIHAADNKLLVVAPIATAMLGILLARAGSEIFVLSWNNIPTYLTFIGLVVCLFFCYSVVSSRINGPKKSLIFFGSISEIDVSAFQSHLDAQSRESLLQDFAAQIHINAVIAARKHASLIKAVLCLAASLPFWGVVMVMG